MSDKRDDFLVRPIITLTASNRAPVLSYARGDLTYGLVSPPASGTTATTSATFSFTDADLADTHAVSVAFDATASGTATPLGALRPVLATDATGGTKGRVTWTYGVDAAALSRLAAGQTVTQVFDVTVSDKHGGTLVRPIAVTLTGRNDAPVLVAASGIKTVGTIAEAVGPSNPLPAVTGSFAFTDLDQIDTHYTLATFDAAASDTTTALGFLQPVIATDSAGGATGRVTWTYRVPATELDQLAAGQSVKQVFDVAVNDAHGGTVVQPITITLTGSNDLPVLSYAQGDMTYGRVSPPASGTVATASGTFSFTDVDTVDTHAVSATFDAAASGTATALGSLRPVLATDSTGGAKGQVAWTYQADAAVLGRLAVGQTVTQVFDVSVSDKHGGTLVRPIAITLTGTGAAPDRAPVLSFGSPSTALEERGYYVDGVSTATIAVSKSDPDVGDTASYILPDWTVVDATHLSKNGSYGSAVLDTRSGVLTYTLDNARAATDALTYGDTVTDGFAIAVRDKHGLTATKTAAFTIKGTGDAPVVSASAPSAALIEAGAGTPGTSSATVTFTAYDPEGSAVSYGAYGKSLDATHVLLAGIYGSAVLDTDTGVLTYTLDNTAAATNALVPGRSATDTVEFFVDDEDYGRTYVTTDFTTQGTNDAPTLVVTGTDTTILASTASDGLQRGRTDPNPGDYHAVDSLSPVLSPDGTKVVFFSEAPALALGNIANSGQLYLKDLATGKTTLIPNADSEGSGDYSSVAFSPDGSELAFGSRATDLVPGGKVEGQVFIENLATGTFKLVSSSSNGTEGDDTSGSPVFSRDGKKVAFFSSADNLVPGDTNGVPDLFVKDLATGAITRVTTFADGVRAYPALGDSVASFSPDGTKVAYDVHTDEPVPDDSDGTTNIFVKDLVTGAVTSVSTTANGIKANGRNYEPVFLTGSKVAFASDASNLVAGDTNGTSDIFVKDLGTGAITRVSTASDGAQLSGHSGNPVASADGSKLVFVTDEFSPSNTNDSQTNVVEKDLATGVVTPVTNSPYFFNLAPALSSDGSRVAFESNDPTLVLVDTNFAYDIFVRDLGSGLVAHPTGTVTDSATQQVLSTTGNLLFTDPEIADTHSVTVKRAAGDLGTLMASLSSDNIAVETKRIDWTYHVDHSALSSLSAGQTRKDTFSVTVADQHGASTTQTVAVTLVGMDHAAGSANRDVSLINPGPTSFATAVPGIGGQTGTGTASLLTDGNVHESSSIATLHPRNSEHISL